jgi:hypothetical protein
VPELLPPPRIEGPPPAASAAPRPERPAAIPLSSRAGASDKK